MTTTIAANATFNEIRPEDFSKIVTDRRRYIWTEEKIWWLLEAQKVSTVSRFIVTVDSMTGHAEGPYRIEGIRQTPGYGTYQVLLVGDNFSDGSRNATWFPIAKLGAIIEISSITAKGIKWVALDIQRERREDNPYYEVAEYIRKGDRERADAKTYSLGNEPGWRYYDR